MATSSYAKAIEALREIVDVVRRNGAESAELAVAAPASLDQVDLVERSLSRPIPEELMEFFLEGTAALNVPWWLERAAGPGLRYFGTSLAGSADISLPDLHILLTNWEGWEDTFRDPGGHAGNNLDLSVADYRRLFPIVSATNGDMVVYVAEGEDKGNVVLLDHEGGDFDRAVLGRSLRDFLCSWMVLGCPGPESWDLEPLYDFDEQRLNPDSAIARKWLKAVRTGVRAPGRPRPRL